MTFYLPTPGNNITTNDIEKGILRITVDVKPHFPPRDGLITIIINDKAHQVNFTKKIGRSDLLYIGKKLFESLAVGKKCRLRITRVNESEFRIENAYFLFLNTETDDIGYKQLLDLKQKYWESLKKTSFPIPPQNGSCVEMIHYFKRKNIGENNQIGPYFGLTVFEAANRIASDLVIINGIIQLIEQKREPKLSRITIRLGNKHIKGQGDFTINGKEGEAFNVAASFYKSKLRTTIAKWPNGLSYILVNAEVFEDLKNE
ncbi:hypothetical protein EON78_01985, partial [bacterium]